MGKEIRFYLAPEDLVDMDRQLKQKVHFIVIADRSSNANPILAELVFPCDQNVKPNLWIHLARHEDFENIVLRYVPAQSYWVVDVLRSPVIEFSRSFFDGVIMRQGRMFFDTGYYDADGKWVEKPEAFLTWAANMFKSTKKVLKRDPVLDAYVGPHAKAWQQQFGGKFTPG